MTEIGCNKNFNENDEKLLPYPLLIKIPIAPSIHCVPIPNSPPLEKLSPYQNPPALPCTTWYTTWYTTSYIHIWNQLRSRILNIPISKHKNLFYKKRQIFRPHFLYLIFLLCWRETIENYLHKPRNLFPNKERRSDKN